ncbi:hypothetical protein [Carboxylicivirga sp. M1479]|uniref:hypothetical protein n=1 Tax=Carboxylicivirga sp. M1479 TaxID=2594476 RepID=UPI0011777503|nr:hypothetical protein [Carboxylicivirga sp. M1479]TRX66178.1 hypothetical protein FNN09_14770 [Carboxylicivirga sp. M1479]
MRQVLTVILFTVSVLCTAQNHLSIEQEAWLYRIVHKTPVLQQNWKHYFSFDKQAFRKEGRFRSYYDYNAIEAYQKLNPKSLTIHYDRIQSSSYGLISEAAIKLTLWELNLELKKYIYQTDQWNDSLLNKFKLPLNKLLSGVSKKKKQAALNIILNPSLPIFKKVELLDKLNIDAEVQKLVLNTWGEQIAAYSRLKSQHFFGILSNQQNLVATTFLAAGEGSGTAGLLYEYELNPQDSSKRWYGKGIGLFTYQVRVRKNQVVLQPQVSKKLVLPANQAIALHTSLWGLDSSFKPMLIITDDSISYHLFADAATNGLSPNKDVSKGISHIERIDEYRQKKIENPLREIQDNGLLKENYRQKEVLEQQLSTLESEIDSIVQLAPSNTDTIAYKKRLIDAKLSTLSKKENRLKELERQLAQKYKDINTAEASLQKMIDLLGPHPQSWTNEDHLFKYATGASFNTITQDLILPSDSTKRTIEVRLIAAGYTLEGIKKDEVQAYVSLTNAREAKPIVTVLPTHVDTMFQYYYHPDETLPYSPLHFDSRLISQINQHSFVKIKLEELTIADSIKSTDTSYKNLQREYQQPRTLNAKNRTTHIHFQSEADTLNIRILAKCDPVPTRLHLTDSSIREVLNVNASSAENNKYLAALRGLYLLESVLNQTKFKEQKHSIINQLPANDKELSTIIQLIEAEH